jgi:hypothetical protein
MSKITIGVIATFLVSFLFLSSCSTKDTSSPTNSPTSKASPSPKVENSSSQNQGFNKDSLTVGQKYIWTGTVAEEGEVLLASEKDSVGNVIEYVAYLSPYCKEEAKSVTSSAKGKKVTVEGTLEGGVLSSTDYNYRADGSRTAHTIRRLTLKDCRVY